jgi:transposase-like protein
MAGKTILNQNIIDRVIEHTLKGISIESVCALSNISPRAYYYWIKQGREDIEEGVESIYTWFAESILAAEAEVEQLLLDLDLPPQKLIQKIS